MHEMKRRIIGITLALVSASLFVGGIIGLIQFVTSLDSHDAAGSQAAEFQPPGRAVWPCNGTGLDMTIMNSCSDDWTAIFNVYVHAWDNGTPDSLTLNTESRTHDPDCETHRGRINVCNGDYGPTDWHGVAYIFGRDRSIMSSTALLNDYYLKGGAVHQRMYTMCHELGHAFALPHTDTDHFNADRGDCMDYTTTYFNNLNPGQVNFDRLYSLYGSANGNGGSGRDSRSLNAHASQVGASEDSVMMDKLNAVKKCFMTMSSSKCMEMLPFDVDGGVRMLRSDGKQEECYEIRFSNGFFVQFHKSLVT